MDVQTQNKKMNENKLNGKIAVLQKQIEVEDDPRKKQELNNKLRVANIEKQIASLRRQIEQLRG